MSGNLAAVDSFAAFYVVFRVFIESVLFGCSGVDGDDVGADSNVSSLHK